MASLDQNTIFGFLSLGGLAVVLRALGSLRTELTRMILESDAFRETVIEIGETLHQTDDFRARVKIVAEETVGAPLRARIKTIEAINRIPETTAIPRERLDA